MTRSARTIGGALAVGILAVAAGLAGPSAAGAAAVSTDAWASPTGGPAGTHANPGETAIGPTNLGRLRQAWTAPGGGQITAADGLAISPNDGTLTAYNPVSGAKVAAVPGDTAVVSGTTVYAVSDSQATHDAVLTAYSATSGAVTWTSSDLGRDLQDLAATGGAVVVTGFVNNPQGNNPLLLEMTTYALNPATGRTLWTASYTGDASKGEDISINGRVVVGGVLYEGVTTSTGPLVEARNVTTGAVLWSEAANAGVESADATHVYVGALQGVYSFAALDASTGAIDWSAHQQLSDGVLGSQLVNEFDGQVTAYNTATGSVLWTVNPSGTSSGYAAPVLANGVAYVASGTTVYGLDLTTGKTLASATFTGDVTPLGIADGSLYLGVTTDSGGTLGTVLVTARLG